MYDHFDLDTTFRWPRIRAFGNWWLGFLELYIRQPKADRYMLVQDDVLFVTNMRQYLEATPYPEKGYCNCVVYPSNYTAGKSGWYRAPSGERTGWRGLGAQCLIFDRHAALALICRQHDDFSLKPTEPQSGHERIDGAVVSKLETVGFLEHVHGPSLTTHIGDQSVMGHPKQPDIAGFPGERFDAMSLLR